MTYVGSRHERILALIADNERSTAMTTSQLIREARDYYRLCDEARALGIPVALDDPRSPQTVAALREAVVKAA